MNSFGKITLAALLGALVVGLPIAAGAQDVGTNSPTPPPAPAPARAAETKPEAKPAKAAKAKAPKDKSTNFRGTLVALDKLARTITVDNKTDKARVFQVTSETRIKKVAAGKATPATFDEGTVGENVSGSWVPADEGKMSLKTLNFRGQTATPAKKAAKKKKPAPEPADATAPATNSVPAK